MRVIAGAARGLALKVPEGRDIRPTLDRVREAVFNIWQIQVPGAHFLDCFAGTGANGIEALSRGAASVTFIERDPQASGIIRENLTRTRLRGDVRLIAGTLPEALAKASAPVPGFDLVYADPPHASDVHEPFLEALGTWPALAPGARIAIETAASRALPEAAGSLRRVRQARYGGTMVHFYTR